jgi:alpha-beta hydrolase superfamily lysophospholipase
VAVEPGFGAVSARAAVRASTGYDQLRVAAGAVYWLESRPGGETSLVRWRPGTAVDEIGSRGLSIGSTVHAYGGGEYAVVGDEVWCAGADGMYRITDGRPPVEAGTASGFGDLAAGDGEVLVVRESAEGDALVAFSLAGGPPRVLRRTPAFLGAPRPGPGWLAWSWWSSDDMPWDACELWVAPYRSGGDVTQARRIAGGPGESVIEPRWGADGSLYFMSDRSGWWNLYRWDRVAVRPVAPLEADCAAEPWELGYSSYALFGDGRVVMTVQRGPRHELVTVDPDGSLRRLGVPYTSIKPYVATLGSSVAVVGSSPTTAPEVALVDLHSTEPPQVLARPEPVGAGMLPVSVPAEVSVPVGDTKTVGALVFPPSGAGTDWCAPVIVRAHPGPTASSLLRLDWQVQFFASRGFAVVDVDYTGSTGRGREFREALYGRWGLDDVADCRAVAEHMIAVGRARPGQVFIRGASAGGYTALQAVAQEGPFAAATAVSAIVDPDRWAETVPRFQRAHAVRLRGGAGAVRGELLRRPVLLIHGTDDNVAAPSDVRRLAARMKDGGGSCELVLLDGVGHYVATSAGAATALEAELAHYRSVLTRVR